MRARSPERPLAVGILVLLGALTAIGPLSLDAYLPALPDIARELAVGPVQVQLSLTACLVGIAAGQLVAGPVSDAVGRRLPLVLGAAGYAAASLACAFAPEIVPFVVLRFAQGFLGAVGVVAARAVIRDVADGPVAVRLFSQLSTFGALAPVVAPLLGAAILLVADWRSVFVVLGMIGVLLTLALVLFFRETLPRVDRHPGTPVAVARGFATVLRERRFLTSLAIGAFAAVLLFAYISGSSFLLQESFGADPGQFALAFALNGLGIATLSQVNARLAPRWGTARMLRLGFAVQAVSALGLLAVALVAPRDPALIPVVMLVFFGVVAPMGVVNPNYIARGMAATSGNAGTASALIGATTFLTGGLVSPLTGLGDPVLTVAGLVVAGAVGGLVFVFAVTRGERGGTAVAPQPDTPGA
jgi:DHA1 family bicyclomycin/chloramphenicol resistance-like MFS transporter